MAHEHLLASNNVYHMDLVITIRLHKSEIHLVMATGSFSTESTRLTTNKDMPNRVLRTSGSRFIANNIDLSTRSCLFISMNMHEHCWKTPNKRLLTSLKIDGRNEDMKRCDRCQGGQKSRTLPRSKNLAKFGYQSCEKIPEL